MAALARIRERLDLVWKRTLKRKFSRAPNVQTWPIPVYRTATCLYSTANDRTRPDPDIATDIEHQGVLPEACGANAPVSKLSSRFLYEVVEFGYTTSQSCNIASGVIRRGRAFG